MLMSQMKSVPQSSFKKLSDKVEVLRYQTTEPVSGYFYTFIVNNDFKHIYKEELTYTVMEGLTLIDNHKGRDGCDIEDNKYSLTVRPGTKKMVILEASPAGYSMAAKKKASFSS